MRLLIGVSAIIVAVAFLCTDAEANSRPIRVTLQLPPGSLLYQNLKYFKDRVEKETHGELAIKLFPSSELYKAHEVPAAVGSGEIEMGASLLVQYLEIVPAVDIFSVPFLFSEPDMLRVATASASPVRVPLDEAILAATGARVLWWVPNGAEAMGSRGPAFRSPSDIAGKKIRVTGSTLAEFVKQCGGTPLISPGSEQYALLKNSEVDGVSTSIESFVSRRLWELVDNIVLIHHVRQVFIVLFNNKVWRLLTQDQQRVLRNAAMAAELAALNKDEAVDRESIATLVRHGLKVTEITSKELDEWKACSSPVSEVFLAKSGAMGEKVITAYRKLLVDSYRIRPGKVAE
jgi:C4-dicarboxylate-binding protein DctP